MNEIEQTNEQEQKSVVPIERLLPELAARQYALVVAWDTARMALAETFEASDGVYLKKIRDELVASEPRGNGLWTKYLEARGIPYGTANQRIRRAEGWVRPTRPLSDKGRTAGVSPTPPEPAPFRTGGSWSPTPFVPSTPDDSWEIDPDADPGPEPEEDDGAWAYAPPPLRPPYDIREEMRQRNIEKGPNELAAEWWGALRQLGLISLTLASAEHTQAILHVETPGTHLLLSLAEAAREVSRIRDALAAIETAVRG